MSKSRRPLLQWFRRLGWFVDTFILRKEVDGVDIPYYFYRLVGKGRTHIFYLEGK